MREEGSRSPQELRLRRKGMTWQSVEGQVVVLDLQHSIYFAANRTGALLWQVLAEGTTRDALVALLVETFDVAPETAAADVDRFLTDLNDRCLLES